MIGSSRSYTSSSPTDFAKSLRRAILNSSEITNQTDIINEEKISLKDNQNTENRDSLSTSLYFWQSFNNLANINKSECQDDDTINLDECELLYLNSTTNN